MEIDVPDGDGDDELGSTRVSELMGRLDSAGEQLADFGRTPKGQRTPAHIRSAGADIWASSSLAQTIPEPSVDEEMAATKLQAVRRGAVARRQYNSQVKASLQVQERLVPHEPSSGIPSPGTTVDNDELSSPTHAISMEAARQRRHAARSEIARLTEQIAAARQEQNDSAGRQTNKLNSRKQLADAQSALSMKEQHLQHRMAQMKRSIEAAQYALEQSEIMSKERDAAIQAVQNKLKYQEFQTNKEAEYAEDVAKGLRNETKANEQVESQLNAVKTAADAADADASAALQELAEVKRANEDCKAELKQAVRAEKSAARARAALQQDIKVRKLQLRQERQECIVSKQELDRVRDRLKQYGGEIDAKIASLEQALNKAVAAQNAADHLHREAEELAAKSKQVVSKQSRLITIETDDMHKAEEKAIRLIKKQAIQLRKTQLALEAAKAVKLPPGAPQPKIRTTDSLPIISKDCTQPGLQMGKSTKPSTESGGKRSEAAPAMKERHAQSECEVVTAMKERHEQSDTGGSCNPASSSKTSESAAPRPTLMVTAPRRRNVSRRQAASRRHTRRRNHKPQQQQLTDRANGSNGTGVIDETEVVEVEHFQGTSALADQLEDTPIGPDEAAQSDIPRETTVAVVEFEPMAGVSKVKPGPESRDSIRGFASIDSSSFANLQAVEYEDRSDSAPVLLSEGQLASIGAHATQNMAAQLMRHAPSLSFLKILSTSERMQYLRPLTPGDDKSQVKNSNDPPAHARARTRARRPKGGGRAAKTAPSSATKSRSGTSNSVISARAGSGSDAAKRDRASQDEPNEEPDEAQVEQEGHKTDPSNADTMQIGSPSANDFGDLLAMTHNG